MIKKIILLLIILFSIYACDDEEFSVPKGKNLRIPNGTIIPLENVRTSVAGKFPQTFVTFEATEQFIEGYVISDDSSGNFFKELFIQNDTIGKTGIHILIDERALNQRFPFGSQVRILLEGLTISEQNGVVTLGKMGNNEVTRIPFTEIDHTIFRTNIKKKIIPRQLQVQDITENSESIYVSFSNMQIESPFITPKLKTFSSESEDNFDGFRSIFSCNADASLTLCTSTFANFSRQSLPLGKGTLTGILTKDFEGFRSVIKLNQFEDINFKSLDRCDPTFFTCENLDKVSSINENNIQIVYQENFDKTTTAKMNTAGWVNINTANGNTIWANKKVTNVDNRVMSISASGTNLKPLEAWLITPPLETKDLLEGQPTHFRVRLRTIRNNGNALTLWITDNTITNEVDGKTILDVNTTDWKLLDVTIPKEHSNYVTLTHKISCLDKGIRIGFKYKGYDPVINSTYEIDEIQFLRID